MDILLLVLPPCVRLCDSQSDTFHTLLLHCLSPNHPKCPQPHPGVAGTLRDVPRTLQQRRGFSPAPQGCARLFFGAHTLELRLGGSSNT